MELWDNRAELAAKSLDMGDRVEVLGEIVCKEWNDRGKKRYDFKIRADRFLNIVKPVKEEIEELPY